MRKKYGWYDSFLIVLMLSFLSEDWVNSPLSLKACVERREIFVTNLCYYLHEFWQMACLASLKQDIRVLESTFPKSHHRFQILSATVDELTCRFIGKNEEKYEIQANITVDKLNLDSIRERVPGSYSTLQCHYQLLC